MGESLEANPVCPLYDCRRGWTLLADLEAQSKKMKMELNKILKNPLYWLILGASMAGRLVLTYLDALHSSGEYWTLAGGFWNKLGSLTMGLLILLVLIHPLTMDRETGTQSVIAGTANGRGRLFQRRLLAGAVSAVWGVVILSLGNTVIAGFLGREIPIPPEWFQSFLLSSGITALGAVGFFLFAACICDMLRNHAAAICICGALFCIPYMLNKSAIHRFEVWWFLLYGTFTQLVRGRWIDDLPVFWIFWYLILLTVLFIFTLKRRKERKE